MLEYTTVVLVAGMLGFLLYRMDKPTVAAPAPEPSKTPRDDYLEVLAAKVAALEGKVAELPSIWTEERKRAERHRARAEESERRTRELLDDSPEDEWDEVDEGPQLRLSDGARSQPEEVQAVSGDVGRSRAADVRARANRLMGL